MIYNLCKKVIEQQKTLKSLDVEKMKDKIDVFLLNNRINKTQYNELIELINW